MLAEAAGEQADVGDDALVRVVVRVEDQALEWLRLASPFGGGTRCDDRLEHLGDAGAVLGRDEQHLLARDGEDVLELLDDDVRLGRRQVDLVDDRDDHESLGEREVDVGQRLGLDALCGVDDEDRALARLQAAADLVAEVDVAGRVDQVEPVALAVLGVVFEAHGARLDGDALLALEVHRVEHLARHLARVDRVRQLEQPVGERGLAVIDMGDDREVAQPRLGDHCAEHTGERPGPMATTTGRSRARPRVRRVIPFGVAPRAPHRALARNIN